VAAPGGKPDAVIGPAVRRNRPGWRVAPGLRQSVPMDLGEHVVGGMRMVEGPVVDRADPFDPESPTTDLADLAVPELTPDRPADPLVPPAGAGLAGWLGGVRFVLRRCGVPLVLIGAVAAVPMHFFTGRVDDTVIAAPALSDLAGGFGLLLLPLMWLAYFAVSALPLVVCLAGVVGVALPAAAGGRLPGVRWVWGLVAYRLRPLWLWFAAFGVASQALPALLTADRLGAGVEVPLAVALSVLSAAVLTFTGVLGCVVLIERGRGLRRAMHLCGRVRLGPLAVAALLLAVLPQIADQVAGDVAATLTAVAAALVWAVAALVSYCSARSAEGHTTSPSLLRELATPETD